MNKNKTSKKFIGTKIIFFAVFIFCFPYYACSFEIETSYTTIIYKDKDILKKFNKKIYTGRLRHYMPDNIDTAEDEARAKIDMIIHRVQSVLEMFPESLKFNLFILNSRDEVRQKHIDIYNKPKDFIAFYSQKMNTIYLSPEKLNINVLAHETGHAVVENYFEVSPPVKVHEILAQFSEKYLGN